MLDTDIGLSASRTFVVPNPGGRRRAISNASDDHSVAGDEVSLGTSPLLRVANPLLNMIYQIRTLVHSSDPSQLRNYLIEEIKKFEQRSKSDAISAETIAAARYCLCTVIDETAAQTPWGGGGIWAKYSLLVTFYNETWGGEKFFQILARVTQTPAIHRDLIELMYFCISLGFEGRYKIVPNGQSQLELLRRRLAEIINDLNGGREKSLSPHWHGIIKPRPPIWTLLPAWVSILWWGVIATALFVFLSFKLSDHSDKVFAQILALPVPVIKEIASPVSIEGRLTALLQSEIDQGLVRVREGSGIAVVTLMGDGLFPSGSVSLSPAYIPVINKVAAAINDYGKGTVVSGHTDNVPIRSARFPSNWHLSVERARAVANQLELEFRFANPFKVLGVGDAEPVESNATEQGRRLNRRVEVKILLRSAN